jgi:hypothetical protein
MKHGTPSRRSEIRQSMIRLAMTEPIDVVEEAIDIAIATIETRRELGLTETEPRLPYTQGTAVPAKPRTRTRQRKPRQAAVAVPPPAATPVAVALAQEPVRPPVPTEAPARFSQPPASDAAPLGAPARRRRGRPRTRPTTDAPAGLDMQPLPKGDDGVRIPPSDDLYARPDDDADEYDRAAVDTD